MAIGDGENDVEMLAMVGVRPCFALPQTNFVSNRVTYRNVLGMGLYSINQSIPSKLADTRAAMPEG
jgi:hypothetical protein